MSDGSDGQRAGTADTSRSACTARSGVLDLVVPAGAAAADVAREYAAQAGLAVHPAAAHPRSASRSTPTSPSPTPASRRAPSWSRRPTRTAAGRRAPPAYRRRPGRAAAETRPLAGARGLRSRSAAACSPAGSPPHHGRHRPRTVAVGLLRRRRGARRAARRPATPPTARVAAPAFAGAAAFAIAWDPEPERAADDPRRRRRSPPRSRPRSRGPGPRGRRGAAGLDRRRRRGLRGHRRRCRWSACDRRSSGRCSLLVAMLAARFVPALAVDVPDQYLIDLERLAVTAWSARDRPRGRRGRTVVPRAARRRGRRARHAHRHRRGGRDAGRGRRSRRRCCSHRDPAVDRIGARCLVGFAGAALLLAARSYRHAAARALLRVAGLAAGWRCSSCCSAAGRRTRGFVLASRSCRSRACSVVAVATGRGWRSAWWSRRAEVAEACAGASRSARWSSPSGCSGSLWELTS